MSVYMTREEFWQPENKARQDDVGNAWKGLVRAVARHLKRNRKWVELSALSDRELRDIGLYRGDIPRVVARMI